MTNEAKFEELDLRPTPRLKTQKNKILGQRKYIYFNTTN